MQVLLDAVAFITAHYQEIITAVVGVLTGVIGISMIIPGDQPEKFLKGIVDFISKFSAKPKDPQ